MGAFHSDAKLQPRPNFPCKTTTKFRQRYPSCSRRTVSSPRNKVKLSQEIIKPDNSRCSFSEAVVCTKLDLNRHNSKASLIPRCFRTPLISRRRKKKLARRSKSIIDENKKERDRKRIKLSRKLKILTKEQLADLILQVSSTNPEIEKVLIR